jgi:Dynamin central region
MERTLCVLTKLDKLRAGAEVGRAVAYLANQRKPLRLGYHGLVNLPPAADEEEARLLRDQPAYERVRDRIGIRPLRQHLIRILAGRVLKMLPGRRRACEARLAEIIAEMESLGMTDENDDESAGLACRVLKLSVQLVKRVEHAVSTQLRGYSTAVSTAEEGLGLRLGCHIKVFQQILLFFFKFFKFTYFKIILYIPIIIEENTAVPYIFVIGFTIAHQQKKKLQ